MFRKTLPSPNAHRAIFERAAYLCFLTLVVGGLGWTSLGLIIGWITGDFRGFFAGLSGVMLACILHPWGYKHWHFSECEASLSYAGESAYGSADAAHEKHAEALRTVLRDLAAERAEERPDVWEVHRLRGEARQLIAGDAALREDFEEELAAHPELLPS